MRDSAFNEDEELPELKELNPDIKEEFIPDDLDELDFEETIYEDDDFDEDDEDYYNEYGFYGD